MFPKWGTGCAIEGHNIAGPALHHRHDDSPVAEHRRCAQIPPERVFAKTFLQIGLPDNAAVGHAQADQFAALIIDPHIFPIRHR